MPMGRTLSILGIIGAALAVLPAIIAGEAIALIVALYAIGAGVYLSLSKDWRRMGPGIAAAVFGLLGILGLLGSVGGENGSVEFPISVALGQAFIVIAALEISGAVVLLSWKQFQPEWISYVWAGFWVLGVLLALVFRTHLSNSAEAGAFVVAALCLANLGAPIMHYLHKE